MNQPELANQLTVPALPEIAHSIGARRCLIDLGTYQGKPVLCQVIIQGGMKGLNQHRLIVHGIVTG